MRGVKPWVKLSNSSRPTSRVKLAGIQYGIFNNGSSDPSKTSPWTAAKLRERFWRMWRRQEGEGKGGGGDDPASEMAAIIAGIVAPEDNPFQNPGVIAADWVGFISVRLSLRPVFSMPPGDRGPFGKLFKTDAHHGRTMHTNTDNTESRPAAPRSIDLHSFQAWCLSRAQQR